MTPFIPFYMPGDISTNRIKSGQPTSVGGVVVPGSVHRETVDGRPIATFGVTDGKATVQVDYRGILPDLFREGNCVVVLGVEQPDGTIRASEVLTKLDENYIPKQDADALKKKGLCQKSDELP